MLAGARPQYIDEVFEHAFRRDGGFEHRLDITYSSVPSTVEAWVDRIGFRTTVLGLDAEWKPVTARGVKPVLALLQLGTEDSALVIQLNALRGGPSHLCELCPKLASLLSGQYHAEASCPPAAASVSPLDQAHPDAALSAVAGAADTCAHDGREADGPAVGGAGAAAMPMPDSAHAISTSASAELSLASKVAASRPPSRRLRVCGVGITADYAKTLADCGIAPHSVPPILVNLAALKKGGPKGLAAIAMAAKAADVTWKKKSLQMCNWEDWPLSRPKVIYAAMDAYAGAASYARLRPSAAAAARDRHDVGASAAGEAVEAADHNGHGGGDDADHDAAAADDSDHYLESGAESDTPAPDRRSGFGGAKQTFDTGAARRTQLEQETEPRPITPALAYFSLDKCGY